MNEGGTKDVGEVERLLMFKGILKVARVIYAKVLQGGTGVTNPENNQVPFA